MADSSSPIGCWRKPPPFRDHDGNRVSSKSDNLEESSVILGIFGRCSRFRGYVDMERSAEGMAENGGFEPPIELSPYNGLANRRLQPLGQLSVCVAVSITYTRCPAVAIIA